MYQALGLLYTYYLHLPSNLEKENLILNLFLDLKKKTKIEGD